MRSHVKLSLRLASISIVVALVILSGGIGYWLGSHHLLVELENGQPQINIERSLPPGRENIDFSLFWDVWDRLETSYLVKEALDPGQMVYGAIKGLTGSLGDPYTVFLPPKKTSKSRKIWVGVLRVSAFSWVIVTVIWR